MASVDQKNWLRAYITGDMATVDALEARMPDAESGEFFTFLVAFASLMIGVRFEDDKSPEAVQKFVDELRYDFRNAEPPIKPLMVEGVVRATLGEEHLFEEIPQDEVAGANFLVITKVANESPKVGDNLESYIARAEQLASGFNG